MNAGQEDMLFRTQQSHFMDRKHEKIPKKGFGQNTIKIKCIHF